MGWNGQQGRRGRFSGAIGQIGARPAQSEALARPALGWRRAALRQGLALAALLIAAFLLRERLAALDLDAILRAARDVTPLQWALSGLATLGSFLALARYDLAIHRTLATGQPAPAARRAGWIAIAISQTVGFGLISGALVRWRLLPGLSLLEASRLTATVAASFLAGWAVVTALAMLVLPVALPGPSAPTLRALAGLALAGGGALAVASLWAPGLRIARWRLRLPSLPVIGQVLMLAAIDTALAALALWVLLPPEAALPFAVLFPAFLLALGAGFVSGTPGGVGPFELTLVMLLPQAPETPLLAAVLAWRVSYFGLPALAALAALALPRALPRTRTSPAPAPATARLLAPGTPPAPALQQLIGAARQAELGLLHQGEHGVLLAPGAQGGWMLGRTPQALVGLLDPFGAAHPARALADLAEAARAEGRLPALYKVSGRVAAIARRAGWQVVPVALECRIDPARFSLDTPAHATLRRKLRKAGRAGLCAARPARPLPLDDMARLNAAWVAAHGGERGFSMGRFTPDYVQGQEVVLAHQHGRLVGFASFHANRHEWVLDLLRPAPDAPDGTAQALIVAALAEAKAAGAACLSLAALPPAAVDAQGLARQVWARAEARAGAAGLRQFKMGFAPRLSPRYIAAPNRAALTLAAADIARAVQSDRHRG